jgi:hypothetical protein
MCQRPATAAEADARSAYADSDVMHGIGSVTVTVSRLWRCLVRGPGVLMGDERRPWLPVISSTGCSRGGGVHVFLPAHAVAPPAGGRIVGDSDARAGGGIVPGPAPGACPGGIRVGGEVGD